MECINSDYDVRGIKVCTNMVKLSVMLRLLPEVKTGILKVIVKSKK